MLSAFSTCNGAIKPFFVNGFGAKGNAQTYKKNLQKELLPVVQHLYIHKN